MATYPWVRGTRSEPQQLESRPNFKRWLDAIGDRPAVKRGVAVMAELPPEPLDAEARSILYGTKQFERRLRARISAGLTVLLVALTKRATRALLSS
jgi:GSH-dependent disulfide-bond oxidoreductase